MGHGIARFIGLGEIMLDELVNFAECTSGIALNLESKNVGIVLMGDGLMIQEESFVKAIERIAQIPRSSFPYKILMSLNNFDFYIFF